VVDAPSRSGDAARTHVVVLGGGFAGLNVAKHLKNADGVVVTLIDRENHHLFQPLLYQIATAALSAGSIAVPIRSVLSRARGTQVLLGEAVGLDAHKKVITLADGDKVPYDVLVVAVGAKTNYFGNDAWANNAIGLKDLRDAIRIRERVLLSFEAAERTDDAELRRRLLSFVVIGGGPTGVEMAGAIAELGRMVLAKDYHRIRGEDIRVTLIEMADRLLTPFSPERSASATQQLRELGVDVRTSTRVTDVTPTEVHAGGEVYPASCVVWASGVQPVKLAAALGFPTDRGGRVVVDGFCNVPGHREIFVLGDVASHTPEGEARPLPGLAPVAIQQGRYAAKTILSDLKGKPRAPFRYRDKGIMATVGRSRAVVESDHIKASGFFAWMMWGVVHIAYLIGFRSRAVVMFEWVWQYLTHKRGARLITARAALQPTPASDVDRPAAEALRQLPQMRESHPPAAG
jgi:NADH dehydrogenase